MKITPIRIGVIKNVQLALIVMIKIGFAPAAGWAVFVISIKLIAIPVPSAK